MSNETLKTSQQWNKEDDHIVMDPDGWDRSSQKAFMFSWYTEEITYDEYIRRRNQSTVGFKPEIKKTTNVKSIFKES